MSHKSNGGKENGFKVTQSLFLKIVCLAAFSAVVCREDIPSQSLSVSVVKFDDEDSDLQ